MNQKKRIHMPSEEQMIKMHEEYYQQVTESGMPVWIADLYEHAQPEPAEDKSSDNSSPSGEEQSDDLPF